jgi:hypothetical protein
MHRIPATIKMTFPIMKVPPDGRRRTASGLDMPVYREVS